MSILQSYPTSEVYWECEPEVARLLGMRGRIVDGMIMLTRGELFMLIEKPPIWLSQDVDLCNRSRQEADDISVWLISNQQPFNTKVFLVPEGKWNENFKAKAEDRNLHPSLRAER